MTSQLLLDPKVLTVVKFPKAKFLGGETLFKFFFLFSLDDESGKITLLKTLQNLTWEPDNEANNIKNLITLPVKVTDGYDCGHRDHTARNKEYKDN